VVIRFTRIAAFLTKQISDPSTILRKGTERKRSQG
jgi:hypothetical protein